MESGGERRRVEITRGLVVGPRATLSGLHGAGSPDYPDQGQHEGLTREQAPREIAADVAAAGDRDLWHLVSGNMMYDGLKR